MSKAKKGNGAVDCFRCVHFYVTWDENFPRGCKAYGFKSRNIPSVDVYRSSGMKCLRFEAEGGEKGEKD